MPLVDKNKKADTNTEIENTSVKLHIRKYRYTQVMNLN